MVGDTPHCNDLVSSHTSIHRRLPLSSTIMCVMTSVQRRRFCWANTFPRPPTLFLRLFPNFWGHCSGTTGDHFCVRLGNDDLNPPPSPPLNLLFIDRVYMVVCRSVRTCIRIYRHTYIWVYICIHVYR